MASWGSIWSGVKTIAGAVGEVFGDRPDGGTPGAARAPSVIG